MNDTQKRCYHCMHKLDSVSSICPYCGRSLKSIYIDEKYLKPGQIISQRYEIGNILYKNAEHIVYIAYDNHLGAVVSIKEFFPLDFAKRNENGAVEPVSGREKFFLEQCELFLYFNQNLSKFRTISNIVQTYSVFSENNTVYAVTENIKGVFLSQYLSEHYGELSWDESSPLFIDLIKILSQLHKIGIVHGSISPDTIYVTDDGKFKLTGFLTPFFCKNNEFVHKPLYDGYAAPEQYNNNDYGSWTDVYSVAAVIYKSLTGTMPTYSNTRSFNDNLIALDTLNSNVPKSVSLAIMSALTISPKLRTQTMDDFLADLVTPPRASQNTGNFNYDKYFDSYGEEYDDDEDDKARTRRYIINALSITLSVLLIASLILIFLVFGNDIFG